MPDDAAMFLSHARQEAGHVLKGDQRDIETITEADESRCLDRGIDVQYSGPHCRLVGNDAHTVATQSCEANDHILGEMLVNLIEVPVVHDHADHIFDIVWFRSE